jgi:putative transposase
MSYAFIAEHVGEFPVRRMCQVLQVSPSGYSDWLKRPPSARQQANDTLWEAIRQVHEASRHTYGSPRIHAALQQQGLRVGRQRVARVMHAHGLVGKAPRGKRPVTTQRESGTLAAPNLLEQDFTASRPNETWLADITSFDTVEGRLYLALVMDLFSRAIVGWSMADQSPPRWSNRPCSWALGRRRWGAPLAASLRPRESVYQCPDPEPAGHPPHPGQHERGGPLLDNAPMESFIGTLKTECALSPLAPRAEVRLVIFDYIEVWYNRQRLHSSLGYLSPATFEYRFYETDTVR